MTIGDPKKAFALSLVALIALAFLAFRILPKAEKAVAQMMVNSGTHTAVAQTAGGYPASVYTDPFSHASLKAVGTSTSAPTATVTTGTPATPTKPLPNALEGEGWGGLGPVEIAPEEITGASQQQQVEKPTVEITLEAILRVENKPMAFLKASKGPDQAGEPESKMYQVGQKVMNAIEVVSISGSEVVFKVKDKRLTLRVGESTKL